MEPLLLSPEDQDLVQYRWCSSNGYLVRKNPNKKPQHLRLHRAIMGRILERQLLPDEQVDHINGNPQDNRRSNLRLATGTQQCANTRPQRSSNTSGYKGVSWDKTNSKWRADIGYHHKQISLGRYDEVKDAARAYDVAARELFGEYARCNF